MAVSKVRLLLSIFLLGHISLVFSNKIANEANDFNDLKQLVLKQQEELEQIKKVNKPTVTEIIVRASEASENTFYMQKFGVLGAEKVGVLGGVKVRKNGRYSVTAQRIFMSNISLESY